jgi:hypothetical protein
MMSVAIKQNADGSMGLQGSDRDDGGFVSVNFHYDANSVDRAVFVAQRAYVVKGVVVRPTVAGTDAGAVTVAVKKAASGTSTSSGTAVHSGTANLKGTIHANQTLTLSSTASDLEIPSGTALGADFTGTMTAAVGVVSVLLAPA